MKNKHFLGAIIVIFTLFTPRVAFGWGDKGHTAIACIAQKHLSCRAEREVTRLLGGYNMAYWASWADGLRDDKRYDALSTWHYANADEGYTYATAPKNPAGDVLTAVEGCIARLRDKSQCDSVRVLSLRLLVHLVGDMHCPMHAGRASDRGGNDYTVTFRGRKTSLHSLWDSQLVDAAHAWSAVEWATNIDRRMSRREARALAAGTPAEWMEETVTLAHTLYAETPKDQSLSWNYIHRWSPLVEDRFISAGYRLARLLNEIF